jgi:hypothetical protein
MIPGNMSQPRLFASPAVPEIRTHSGPGLGPHLQRLEAYVARSGPEVPLSYHPAWLAVLAQGLQHTPYLLEAVEGEKTCGLLALAYVRSWLFGRFLVSLPYVNYGGVLADNDRVAGLLIDRAVQLAEQLDVRYLELRHQQAVEHPVLLHQMSTKVHMRLALPPTP